MQQTDDATPQDSGTQPSADQSPVRTLASDARSVQAMPRLLLVVTVLLFCLRLGAYVMQSHSPAGNTQQAAPAPAGKEGAEL
jgi:hypothetical protein